MELQDLRYFLEVRSRGSLTAAARTLGISQPSLTTAMQRLERHLGTTLLLRERTGVKLTVTGRALAHDAEEMVAIAARAERRVLGLEDAESGRFVVGCHESLGAYFLPSLLKDLFESHPGIEVAVHNGASAAVRDLTIDRGIDFGLVVNPKPHPDLVLVDLFDDAIDFFTLAAPTDASRRSGSAPKSSRDGRAVADQTLGAARTLDVAFERIRRGPVVHAGRVSESQALLGELEPRGVVPQRVLSCGDFELVKSILLAGVGIGLLPRRVARYGHDGKLVRLHPELPSYADRICLVYRADLHKTKAATALKDVITSHGRRLQRAG